MKIAKIIQVAFTTAPEKEVRYEEASFLGGNYKNALFVVC